MEDIAILKHIGSCKERDRRKMIKLIFTIFLLCICSSCSASSSDISGTVIDAETGGPIEGAVVLVEWTKTKGFGLTHTESYKVVEVLTDKDGKFRVPGIRAIFADPHLTIYKKGYVAWNDEYIFPGYTKRADFEWGKTTTFKLEHFKPEYSYDKHTSFISSVTNSSIGTKKAISEAYRWEELKASDELDEKWKILQNKARGTSHD